MLIFSFSFNLKRYCYKNLKGSPKLRNAQRSVKTVVMIVNFVKHIVYLKTNLWFKTIPFQSRTPLHICKSVSGRYFFVLRNTILLQRSFYTDFNLVVFQ